MSIAGAFRSGRAPAAILTVGGDNAFRGMIAITMPSVRVETGLKTAPRHAVGRKHQA